MSQALTHLLDTSVFSQPIKDKPLLAPLERWSALGDGVVCTSAISLAEVIQGLVQRDSSKYWRRFRELIEDRYLVLPFDEAVAATYGSLAGQLRRIGNPKPILDLQIAATAKQHGLVVATLNADDFAGIPGVAVEDWSDPQTD